MITLNNNKENLFRQNYDLLSSLLTCVQLKVLASGYVNEFLNDTK